MNGSHANGVSVVGTARRHGEALNVQPVVAVEDVPRPQAPDPDPASQLPHSEPRSSLTQHAMGRMAAARCRAGASDSVTIEHTSGQRSSTGSVPRRRRERGMLKG